MGLSYLDVVVNTDIFSLLKQKMVTVGSFEVWRVSLGLGRQGDSEEKLFGEVRKYAPNEWFGELLVWLGMIWGRSGSVTL